MANIKKNWSAETQEQTHELLASGMVFPGMDGRIHFKNIDGRFADASLSDVLSAPINIRDSETGEEFSFASVKSLLSGGWVLD